MKEEATPTATLEPTATLDPPLPLQALRLLQTFCLPQLSTPRMNSRRTTVDVDYLDADVGTSSADLRWIIEMRLYQDAVYDIITADVAKSHDQMGTSHRSSR